MDNQLDQWVKEAQQSAVQFDNDWDIDAVMWDDLDSNSVRNYTDRYLMRYQRVAERKSLLMLLIGLG